MVLVRHLFSKLQDQTWRVFAQKNAKNTHTHTHTHCTKTLSPKHLSPGVWWQVESKENIHGHVHEGNSRSWRSFKSLRKFIEVENSMAKHRISTLRSSSRKRQIQWYDTVRSEWIGPLETLPALEAGYMLSSLGPNAFNPHMKLHGPSDMYLKQRLTKVATTRCDHLRSVPSETENTLIH